jgi:O-antigen ligase
MAAAIPANESLAAGNWTDLAVGSFVVLPRPQLFALRNGTGLRLTWSAAFTNQVLESATGLSGAWSEVLTTPTLAGDHFEVDQTTASSPCFYRLRGQ